MSPLIVLITAFILPLSAPCYSARSDRREVMQTDFTNSPEVLKSSQHLAAEGPPQNTLEILYTL